jgi:CheY-like chemotaxis protein
MFNKDFRTGSKDLDEYLNARQNAQNRRQNGPQLSDQEVPCPDVLLVEDDLAGAALVLKFCKKLKLQCVHVESLDEAKVIFDKHQDRLRLILLDHFVRVLDAKTNGPKTGAEWAKELNHNFPKGDRFFHIAILTGHTHLLNELSQEADIVLQKPWDPKELFRYLKQNNIA